MCDPGCRQHDGGRRQLIGGHAIDQRLKMAHRRHTHLEEPTVAASDAMILDHFGKLAMERVGIEAAIPDAGCLDERDDGQAYLGWVNLRMVTGDDAALL